MFRGSEISSEVRKKADEIAVLKHKRQLILLSRKISLRCLDYCIDFPKAKWTISEEQCALECAAQLIQETELVGGCINSKLEESLKEVKERFAQQPPQQSQQQLPSDIQQ